MTYMTTSMTTYMTHRQFQRLDIRVGAQLAVALPRHAGEVPGGKAVLGRLHGRTLEGIFLDVALGHDEGQMWLV